MMEITEWRNSHCWHRWHSFLFCNTVKSELTSWSGNILLIFNDLKDCSSLVYWLLFGQFHNIWQGCCLVLHLDKLSQLMRLWYLSLRRPAKAQASLSTGYEMTEMIRNDLGTNWPPYSYFVPIWPRYEMVVNGYEMTEEWVRNEQSSYKMTLVRNDLGTKWLETYGLGERKFLRTSIVTWPIWSPYPYGKNL